MSSAACGGASRRGSSTRGGRSSSATSRARVPSTSARSTLPTATTRSGSSMPSSRCGTGSSTTPGTSGTVQCRSSPGWTSYGTSTSTWRSCSAPLPMRARCLSAGWRGAPTRPVGTLTSSLSCGMGRSSVPGQSMSALWLSTQGRTPSSATLSLR
uniref:Uncharacterized protein n=1 Tax=Arundo donax TaxID=35708 RepID=A0A0A9FV89_ARUDO